MQVVYTQLSHFVCCAHLDVETGSAMEQGTRDKSVAGEIIECCIYPPTKRSTPTLLRTRITAKRLFLVARLLSGQLFTGQEKKVDLVLLDQISFPGKRLRLRSIMIM